MSMCVEGEGMKEGVALALALACTDCAMLCAIVELPWTSMVGDLQLHERFAQSSFAVDRIALLRRTVLYADLLVDFRALRDGRASRVLL